MAAKARAKLSEMNDVPCEMVTLQSCLGVCKITHLLRTAGHLISKPALDAHYDQLRVSLESLLGCQIPAHSMDQVACGTRIGGLGFRRARDLTTLVFRASRLDCKYVYLSEYVRD